MKLVKKFVFTVLFVSAVAVNTYAGDLETPGLAAPPPVQSTNSTTTATATSVGGGTAAQSNQTAMTPSDELLYQALMALMSLFK